MLPFLAVGHDLGEGLFSLLVVVAQGPVAGGQGLVPPGAVVVAGLAGGGGFGVGAAGAQGGVEGAEPGQAEQQFLGFLRIHLPGFQREYQGELLEQVVPGPGRMPVRYQDQGFGQGPRLASRVGGPDGARPP